MIFFATALVEDSLFQCVQVNMGEGGVAVSGGGRDRGVSLLSRYG